MWGKAGRDREEQRTRLISSSVQPPPLFSVKWEEGALEFPLRQSDAKPLPFADPRKKCRLLSALPRLETQVRLSAQNHSSVPQSPSSSYFLDSDLQFSGHREASQPGLKS